MSRFLDPYYFANSLLLLAYGALRAYFTHLTPEGSQHSRFHSLQDLSAWEKQALSVVLAIMAYRGLRRRSWDHCAQQLFFFGKVVVGLTAIMVDRRLAVWYALAVWACYVAFPQPILRMSTGRADDKVAILTPVRMKEWVLRGEDDWVVFFYTENHHDSIAMAPAFVELAHKYASERLCFGVMDACLWPSFSKELKLRPNSWSNQLPAVVRYARGKEQGRVPAAMPSNDLGLRHNFFTKRDVVKKLALEEAPGSKAGGKKQR